MKQTVYPRRASAWLIAGLLFGGLTGSASGASYALVKDGKARCAVLMENSAGVIEHHAADELRTYFKKVSGTDIAQVESIEKGTTPFPIILGTPESSPAIKNSGLLPRIERLSEEGFIIKADKNGLFIAGKKPMGVLYGVYSFLEEYLDIRWFFPGEKGEYCSQRSTIKIRPIDKTENPAFTVRTLNHTCMNIDTKIIDTWDWLVRNKMQVRWLPFTQNEKELTERGTVMDDGGHALAKLVPPAKYFQDHPEYFSLVSGRRMPCFPKEGGVYQLCTSNSEVIDICARGIIASFKERNPLFYMTPDTFALGNNDGNGWCECDACRAMDDPEEQKQGLVTTRFYTFINTVAERVLKECPDKTMMGWGYQLFQGPPKHMKPDPRLWIMMAMHGRCYQHSYDDPACSANREKISMLKGWRAFGNLTGVYEFFSCFVQDSALAYLPLENVAARDVTCLWNAGITYWKAEIPPPDGFFGPLWNRWEIKEIWYAQFPTYYLVSKLLWNPSLDPGPLKDDMYRKYYGPAAKAMRSYRELLGESWEKAEGHFIFGTPVSHIGKCLVRPGLEQELLNTLAMAETSAGDDQALQEKIAREKRYFAEVWQKALVDWEAITRLEEVQARKREGRILLDGVMREPDWEAAVYATGFIAGNTGKPARAQTFVKLLYDDDSLYVGVTALTPSPGPLPARYARGDKPALKDDTIEVFIDPEGDGTTYYRFTVNPKGIIDTSKCSRGADDTNFKADCEAAGKTLKDRWNLEMKIKTSSLNAQAVEGGIWKMNIGRLRRTDEVEESSWAVDGALHATAAFRPVVFGNAPRVQNGGFESVTEVKAMPKKGWTSGNTPIVFPAGWSLHDTSVGKLTLVADDVHSGKKACQLEHGWITSYFDATTGDILHIDFWAKGEGAIMLMLFQYRKNADGNPVFLKTAEISRIELSSKWQRHKMDYTIQHDNVAMVGLTFGADGTMVLDDVAARIQILPRQQGSPAQPHKE